MYDVDDDDDYYGYDDDYDNDYDNDDDCDDIYDL